jgi:SAM-dependent methyltransferase
MGLTLLALTILKPYLKAPGRKTVLSLGYQDIVAEPKEVEDLFGSKVTRVTNHGGWHGRKHPLPETEEFFQGLDCDHVCVDIVKARGTEIIVDLNTAYLPFYLCGAAQYDIVIDGGTLEHVFNIGHALKSVAECVKPGGVILHGNPLSMVNHGFYMLSPTLYHDFYTQNGWQIEQMMAARGNEVSEISPTKRVTVAPELSMIVLAKRFTNEPMKFPTQTKYLKNPTLSSNA